jgi:diguanylate cyclase (GGDEF)-like protein
MIKTSATDYESFMKDNRQMVNRYLNTVLWFCVLTGPAIAAGIRFGVFDAVSYRTCILISVVMTLVSAIHFVVIRKFPYSRYVGILALIAMEILLLRMEYGHIHINISWFFVPLLSILFCEKKLFFITILTNFIAMTCSTWLISSYNSQINTSFSSSLAFFANAMAGYGIETIVMTVAGIALITVLQGYFSDLISKNREGRDNSDRLRAQMNILFSMAEVYDNVNLIDFREMTETSLSDKTTESRSLNFREHAHSIMNHQIKRKVDPSQLDDFLDFTNLRTLKQRLTGKRFIYREFINVETGWFRAQYINVEADEKGTPFLVVYTVQNINMDKRREEDLIRISLTDELTQLFNRRSLDDDLAKYRRQPLEDDFVIASVDINRLKYANDTWGHTAGDELILAAAKCLTDVIGNSGKIYRTGGDEFTVIIHTNDFSQLDSSLRKKAAAWEGIHCPSLSLSIGHASARDNPGATLEQLKQIADSNMYKDKNKFYKETGLDRRSM